MGLKKDIRRLANASKKFRHRPGSLTFPTIIIRRFLYTHLLITPHKIYIVNNVRRRTARPKWHFSCVSPAILLLPSRAVSSSGCTVPGPSVAARGGFSGRTPFWSSPFCSGTIFWSGPRSARVLGSAVGDVFRWGSGFLRTRVWAGRAGLRRMPCAASFPPGWLRWSPLV